MATTKHKKSKSKSKSKSKPKLKSKINPKSKSKVKSKGNVKRNVKKNMKTNIKNIKKISDITNILSKIKNEKINSRNDYIKKILEQKKLLDQENNILERLGHGQLPITYNKRFNKINKSHIPKGFFPLQNKYYDDNTNNNQVNLKPIPVNTVSTTLPLNPTTTTTASDKDFRKTINECNKSLLKLYKSKEKNKSIDIQEKNGLLSVIINSPAGEMVYYIPQGYQLNDKKNKLIKIKT